MNDALLWNVILSHAPDPLILVLLAAIAPFQPHFLEQVVNVNWGGLAVEFGDRDQDAPVPSTGLNKG